MNIRDREGLKAQAAQRLSVASYHPGKLSLIHGAVGVALSLILSLLSLALSHGIEGTGGLSGLGTRNILETVQALLSYGYTLLMPFWQIGILFAFLCIVRGQGAGPESLLRGFYRFGPLLRLKLLEMLVYFGIAMICAYLSSFLAMSFSPAMLEMMEPIAMEMMEDPNADVYALMEQIPQQEMLQAMLPMLLIFAAVYLAAVVLVGYRLRFAQYLIVDDPGFGAFSAMRGSLQLTKRNCIALFRLDLSFWWYYLLQAVAVAVSLADVLLRAAGVQLPVSNQWSAVICYCVYGVILLSLNYLYRPQVEATYALAYDSLKNPPLAKVDEII